MFKKQFNELVLVKGNKNSRMLKKAVKISMYGKDKSGRKLLVLSTEMQKIFGDFDGHISIQRSPTRWVNKEYLPRAINFIRQLI